MNFVSHYMMKSKLSQLTFVYDMERFEGSTNNVICLGIYEYGPVCAAALAWFGQLRFAATWTELQHFVEPPITYP